MTQEIHPASSPVQLPAPKSATVIAEEMLGDIDWLEATQGYCDCPGRKAHTNRTGHRDCIIYLGGTPTLYCVHASCADYVAVANTKLRKAILNGDKVEARQLTQEDKLRLKQREDNERIRHRAMMALPQILEEHAWSYDQIISDSPVNIVGNEADHWKLLLPKFNLDDVVWIGGTFDSGKPEHARNFRPVIDWLMENKAPGPFICPVGFKNNSCARTNDNVLVRRFLVVESDTLKRDEVGAVFRWLRESCELKLVAVVDTAGKSLHAWFDYADCEDVLDDLKLVLPALQCDPKLFTASQPVRLPGALRDGRFQKLVYLANSEVVCE